MPEPQKSTDPRPIDEEDLNRPIVLTVDGETETIPLSELKARVQKRGHAERLTQTLKDKEREFDGDIDVAHNLKAGLKDRNEESLRRAFKGVGATEEELAVLFGGVQTSDAGPEEPPADEGADENEDYSALQAEMQGLRGEIDTLKKERNVEKLEGQKRQIWSQVTAAVDSHEALGRIKGRLSSDEARKGFDQRAYLAVVKAMETMPWGDRAIKRGLELLETTLKDEMQAFGGEDNPQAGTEDDRILLSGFGPSGLSASRIHQAAAKTVSPQHADYEMNVLSRILRKIGKTGKP